MSEVILDREGITKRFCGRCGFVTIRVSQGKCQLCNRKRVREWRLKNIRRARLGSSIRSAFWQLTHPDRALAQTRKQKTGWTQERFDQAWKEQNGRCAICRRRMHRHRRGDGRHVAADHCHKRNRTRGLLCFKCNAGFGMFGDNEKLLRKALEYLEAHDG